MARRSLSRLVDGFSFFCVIFSFSCLIISRVELKHVGKACNMGSNENIFEITALDMFAYLCVDGLVVFVAHQG